MSGLPIAIAILVWQYNTASTDGWVFWLVWPMMIIHQIEENVLTELFLGRRMAFLNWVDRQGFDISPHRALMLNCVVGWTLAILSGVIGTHWIQFPLFVVLVELINAFWHVSITSLQQAWSPGTLSSILVTIPICFAIINWAYSHQLATGFDCFILFVLATVSHHFFFRSLPRHSHISSPSFD